MHDCFKHRMWSKYATECTPPPHQHTHTHTYFKQLWWALHKDTVDRPRDTEPHDGLVVVQAGDWHNAVQRSRLLQSCVLHQSKTPRRRDIHIQTSASHVNHMTLYRHHTSITWHCIGITCQSHDTIGITRQSHDTVSASHVNHMTLYQQRDSLWQIFLDGQSYQHSTILQEVATPSCVFTGKTGIYNLTLTLTLDHTEKRLDLFTLNTRWAHWILYTLVPKALPLNPVYPCA